MEKKDRDRFDFQLTKPPPGVRLDSEVRRDLAADESKSFAAFMNQHQAFVSEVSGG